MNTGKQQCAWKSQFVYLGKKCKLNKILAKI